MCLGNTEISLIFYDLKRTNIFFLEICKIIILMEQNRTVYPFFPITVKACFLWTLNNVTIVMCSVAHICNMTYCLRRSKMPKWYFHHQKKTEHENYAYMHGEKTSLHKGCFTLTMFPLKSMLGNFLLMYLMALSMALSVRMDSRCLGSAQVCNRG